MDIGLLIMGSAIIAGYAFLIFVFLKGWYRLPKISETAEKPEVCISVIIPFRNEARLLPFLLKSFNEQTFPPKQVEWILVNDFSQDASAAIAERWAALHSNARVVHLEKQGGKKAALHTGIANARFGYIATTDADCMVHPHWLFSIATWVRKTQASLLAGPVQIDGHSLWGLLQALEFSSLIASAAGAFGINRPVMANGANLAFSKAAYLKVHNTLPAHIASGDDMFLLHALKKDAWHRTAFMITPYAMVRTQAAPNLAAFVRQRTRWTTKSAHYSDTFTNLTALTVFAASLMLVVAFCYGCITTNFIPWLMFLAVKSLPDWLLLRAYHRFFGTPFLMWLFVPLQLVYPFYVLGTALYSQKGGYQWKNRWYRQ